MPVPATTPFSRDYLLATNAAAARAKLGVMTNGTTVIGSNSVAAGFGTEVSTNGGNYTVAIDTNTVVVGDTNATTGRIDYPQALGFTNSNNYFSGQYNGIRIGSTLTPNLLMYLDGGSNLVFGPPYNAFGTNILYFGTNATQSAVQTALFTPDTLVHFYPGDYYNLTNLVCTNGTSIEGYGAVWHFPATGAGWMLTVPTNLTRFGFIKGLHLKGGEENSDWKANPKGVPWPMIENDEYPNLLLFGKTYFSNRSGLFVSEQCGGTVEDVDSEGFSGYGITVFNLYDQNAYTHTHTTWKGVRTYNNFCGYWPSSTDFDLTPTNTNSGTPSFFMTAHYHANQAIQSFNNTIGANLGAGNINVADANLLANWLGFYCEGSRGITGHGQIADLHVNHNTHAMAAYNLDTGMDLNHIYFYGGGDIFIYECRDIEMTRCFFDATQVGVITVIVTNQTIAGFNRIHDCAYLGTNIQFVMTSTIATNYEYNNYSMSQPTTHSALGLFADGIYGQGSGLTNLYAYVSMGLTNACPFSTNAIDTVTNIKTYVQSDITRLKADAATKSCTVTSMVPGVVTVNGIFYINSMPAVALAAPLAAYIYTNGVVAATIAYGYAFQTASSATISRSINFSGSVVVGANTYIQVRPANLSPGAGTSWDDPASETTPHIFWNLTR